MKWNTKSFNELQRTWYQRLKDEGFRDAEELVGTELILKTDSVVSSIQRDTARCQLKALYFDLIQKMISETQFESPIDLTILLRHSEGKRSPEIIAELNNMGMEICQKLVLTRIKSYEVRWGIRRMRRQPLPKAS